MADTAKRIVGPVALGISSATVYTVPGSTTTIMRHLRVVNTGAVEAAFRLSIGVDAAGTRLYSDLLIPAGGVLVWTGFEVLETGETLRAQSSLATALTLTISGVETTP